MRHMINYAWRLIHKNLASRWCSSAWNVNDASESSCFFCRRRCPARHILLWRNKDSRYLSTLCSPEDCRLALAAACVELPAPPSPAVSRLQAGSKDTDNPSRRRIFCVPSSRLSHRDFDISRTSDFSNVALCSSSSDSTCRHHHRFSSWVLYRLERHVSGSWIECVTQLDISKFVSASYYEEHFFIFREFFRIRSGC